MQIQPPAESTKIPHCHSLAIFHRRRGIARNFRSGNHFPYQKIQNGRENCCLLAIFDGKPIARDFLAAALAPEPVMIFVSKHFAHHTLPCVLGAFSEGLSVREIGTQSWNEEAQKELGWELAVDFWFCGTNPVPNSTRAWHEFCYVPKSPRNCSAFPPPKTHAESTPPSGPKPTPILETFFLTGFSGKLYFCLLQELLATQPREHRLSDLDFPGQMFTPDSLCACAALSVSGSSKKSQPRPQRFARFWCTQTPNFLPSDAGSAI